MRLAATSNSRTIRRRRAAAVAAILTCALAPTAEAAGPTRGVTMIAGQTLPSASWSGEPLSDGAGTAAAVVAYETSPGSTALDPAAAEGCVQVQREYSRYDRKTRSTTKTYERDGGCGPLTVRGLASGSVSVSGSLPSQQRPGERLTIDIRAAGQSMAYPAAPLRSTPCPSGPGLTIPVPCSLSPSRGGVYRWAIHSGTVSSSAVGAFEVGSLGGSTYIWELLVP